MIQAPLRPFFWRIEFSRPTEAMVLTPFSPLFGVHSIEKFTGRGAFELDRWVSCWLEENPAKSRKKNGVKSDENTLSWAENLTYGLNLNRVIMF